MLSCQESMTTLSSSPGSLAGLLTFIGDRLGVELYHAAVFAFGVRLFNNLARIRRLLLVRIG